MTIDIEQKIPVIKSNEIFLNHAAISQIAPSTAQASIDALTSLATGHPDIKGWIEAMEESRKAIALLMGASSASSIAFLQNTSQAISVIAEGISWKEGDEVLVPSIEYPANQYPWLNLERRGVVVKRITPIDGRITPEFIAEHITSKTRLVSFSHIEFHNGFRADVKAIVSLCKKHNILTSVDVIQSLGAFRVAVAEWGVDFAAAGSQKWLMAPPGIGILYVSPDRIRELRPVITGAFSVVDPLDVENIALEFPNDCHRFESGTMNFTLFPAFQNAINVVLEKGIDSISSEILKRTSFLVEQLEQKGYTVLSEKERGFSSGIVLFTREGEDMFALFKRLYKEGGVIATFRGDTIRFAPHYYTPIELLEKVIELL